MFAAGPRTADWRNYSSKFEYDSVVGLPKRSNCENRRPSVTESHIEGLKMLSWSVYQFLPRDSHLCLNDVDQGQLGITEQVVERAASYEQKLRRAVQDGKSRDLASNIRRLSEEYQVLRISLVR